MGCGSGSGGCSSGGCSSGGCSSGGCSSMSVHDWLSDVSMPGDPFDVIEIKFKGGRKGFYRNVNNYVFATGDQVVVDAGSGHDVGTVSLQGELVRLQMKKKKVKNDDDLSVIYRLASERDLERHQEAKNREISTLYRGREIITSLKLGMKLSDIEYQSDNTKATFYYSADDRVDFRELIKSLASEFKIRVEMRQISLRQEAGRVGGVGSCGRELCCTTWLTEFKSVSTSAARYQNLSLNPLKLSGQCGRLKCCLNYELDTYLIELKDIPAINKPLVTEEGEATLFKTDIFKKMMWFGFKGDSNWHAVPIARVNELIELNKQGVTPHSLLLDETEEVEEIAVNHDLLQLDKKYRGKGKPKGKGKGSSKSNNRKPSAKTDQRRGTDQKRGADAKKRPDRKGPNNRNKKGQGQRVNPVQNKTDQSSKDGQNTVAKEGEKQQVKSNRPKGQKRPNNKNNRRDQVNKPKGDNVQSRQPQVKRESLDKNVSNPETSKPKRPTRSKVKIQREGVKDEINPKNRPENKNRKPRPQRTNRKDNGNDKKA